MKTAEVAPVELFCAREISAQRTGSSEGIVGVSFQMKVGERVAFIGPEAQGQHLFLRVLMGLKPHASGSLQVFGKQIPILSDDSDWGEILPRELRRKFGVTLKQDGLLSNVSIREGLELLFRFKYGDHSVKLREGAAKVVQSLCERFRLSHVADKRPFHLTRTQRRLAALARAFLSKPSVIFLENPSQDIHDLDRELFFEVLDYISNQEERSLLISTQDYELALRYAQRWVLFENGRILFDGSVEEFFQSNLSLAESIRKLKKRPDFADMKFSKSQKESA